MIASRYSVDQSSSVAGFTRAIDGLRRRIAPDLAAGVEQHGDQRRKCVAAAARSTSRVSAAPHTPVRRILALSTIVFAISRSAALST